jgi:hypothetical protein
LKTYNPKKAMLNFIAPDGMAGGGIMGDRAHVKAAELIRSGSAIVRICGIDSKMNRKRRTEHGTRRTEHGTRHSELA